MQMDGMVMIVFRGDDWSGETVFGLSFLQIAHQPGSPGDVALWRTMATAFFVLAMIIALVGSLSSLFEQAERRAEDARIARRKRR